MSKLTRIRAAVMRWISDWRPGGLGFGIGRSVLAASTASVVLFSSDAVLFVSADGQERMRCDGVRGLSLWCAAGDTGIGTGVSRAVTLAVLGVVIAGYRPGWTCVPHWFVSWSLAASMTQPNGGDQVAQIVTLLLVPLCLADGRTWHWSRTGIPRSGWRGVGRAAQVALQVQLAFIYANAAIAKLAHREWRHGTAMYSVLTDPEYGAPPAVLDILHRFDGRWLSAPLTWGTIAVELTMAVLLLGSRRMRTGALVLAVAFHGTIGIVMGLGSFSAIMIGSVLVAQVDREPVDHEPAVPAEIPTFSAKSHKI